MSRYTVTTSPLASEQGRYSSETVLPPELTETKPPTPAVAKLLARIRNQLAHPATSNVFSTGVIHEFVFDAAPVYEFLFSRPVATDAEKIFDAIQALYLSSNQRQHGRQIAERITTLHRDALEENEAIKPSSLKQFTEFFVSHDLGFPKVTLTPDGTLRARWIHGPNNFVAIEFLGGAAVKLVAEVPRPNEPAAKIFATESVAKVVETAHAIGASFA
jgi:hypothetical protein